MPTPYSNTPHTPRTPTIFTSRAPLVSPFDNPTVPFHERAMRRIPSRTPHPKAGATAIVIAAFLAGLTWLILAAGTVLFASLTVVGLYNLGELLLH
jgi:hypothetical protein